MNDKDFGCKRAVLLHRVELMIGYLKLKLESGDWHGVADAAMDIREMEAQIFLLDQIIDGYFKDNAG